MNKLAIPLILLFVTSAYTQRTFDIKDASKYFDIKIKIEACDDATLCSGKGSYSFYKKGGTTPYQVITLSETSIHINDDAKVVGGVLPYDKQSAVAVEDYNFDGMEDVSLSTGDNGGYGSTAYNIYLSSRSAGKFVYDAAFTKALASLGNIDIDKQKKTFSTFNKDGCCWHVTDRYKVVANRPVKVWEEIEDATIPDKTKVKVTTKELVGGRWKTTVRYEKREQ
ncbi:MAG TPA: hypothetical protein VGI80_02975 [Pyrinomonadaceae bacterium]|jgi:hypothetical protein